MSKKFSIVRTKIDISKLLNNIEEYSIINMVNPYLFMNKDTIDELISQIGYKPDGLWVLNQVVCVDIFKDIKYSVIIR